MTYKSQTSGYDALNRLTDWADAGGTTVPDASQHLEYDAAGNVRRRVSSYRATVGGAQTSYDDWFRYDAMDRIVTDRGRLSGTAGASGTTVIRGVTTAAGGPAGIDYAYNLAGDRVGSTVTTRYQLDAYSPGEHVHYTGSYDLVLRTDYQYDVDGQQTEAAPGPPLTRR